MNTASQRPAHGGAQSISARFAPGQRDGEPIGQIGVSAPAPAWVAHGRLVSLTTAACSPRGAVEEFMAQYRCLPLRVERSGRAIAVLGRCVWCSTPVLETNCYTDGDVLLCSRCAPERAA